MKKYTYGKKVFAVVIHQMFFVMMICSIFAMNELVKKGAMNSIMQLSFFSVIGLVGTFVALAYLTNASGYRTEDENEIHLHPMDKVYSDFLILVFVVVVWIFMRYVMKLRGQDFELSGLLVASGTLAYVSDIFFLVFYLSIVRRSKANTLYENSLIYKIVDWTASKMGSHANKQPFTRKGHERKLIKEALDAIALGAVDTKLDLDFFHGEERALAESVNHISDGMSEALSESVRNERMKADLITNVSHDIKTPLTSIVNYVDLLKREDIANDKAQKYIHILDEKSQRLKHLTEDLVEASKISSGNVKLDMQRIDFVELLYQTGGEFNERFEARNLTIVTKLPHNAIFIRADGRQLYRTIENLYTNAAKYALENTRVYVELSVEQERAIFCIKNISKNQYETDLASDALTERFVRGEVSRTTEGSGLGLSIAKNLTELMGGDFNLAIDGDLFIITVSFKIA